MLAVVAFSPSLPVMENHDSSPSTCSQEAYAPSSPEMCFCLTVHEPLESGRRQMTPSTEIPDLRRDSVYIGMKQRSQDAAMKRRAK